jgi:hypothetical protein
MAAPNHDKPAGRKAAPTFCFLSQEVMSKVKEKLA